MIFSSNAARTMHSADIQQWLCSSNINSFKMPGHVVASSLNESFIMF